MGKPKITPEEFDPDRIVNFKVTVSTTKNSTIKYYRISFDYKYEIISKDGKKYDQIAPLIIEYPEVVSKRGLQFRIKKGEAAQRLTYEQYIEVEKKSWSEDKKMINRTEAALAVSFDRSNEEHVKFTGKYVDDVTKDEFEEDGFIPRLHDICITKLLSVRSEIGLPTKNDRAKMAGCFREGHPLYYNIDKSTGLRIPNANASTFLKLKTFGNFGSKNRYESPFTLPIKSDGKNYDKLTFADMAGNELKYVPLVLYKGLIVSSDQIKYDNEVIEAVVLSIKPASSESNQEDILEDYANDENVINSLDENIKWLNELRKKNEIETHDKPIEKTQEDKQELSSIFKDYTQHEDKKDEEKKEEEKKEEEKKDEKNTAPPSEEQNKLRNLVTRGRSAR